MNQDEEPGEAESDGHPAGELPEIEGQGVAAKSDGHPAGELPETGHGEAATSDGHPAHELPETEDHVEDGAGLADMGPHQQPQVEGSSAMEPIQEDQLNQLNQLDPAVQHMEPNVLGDEEEYIFFDANVDDYNIDSDVDGAPARPGPSRPVADNALCPVAPAAEEPSASGESHAKKIGGNQQKINQTPPALFKPIEPNHQFRLSVNFGDWRFRAETKMKSDKWTWPYSNSTYSKSFASDKTQWRSCLKECHKWLWKKFELVKTEVDPDGKIQMQTPGLIPDEVYKSIESDLIDDLPAPIKYSK